MTDDEGRRISRSFSGHGLPVNGEATADISFGEFETDYDADAAYADCSEGQYMKTG